jgi:hypothetical protein
LNISGRYQAHNRYLEFNCFLHNQPESLAIINNPDRVTLPQFSGKSFIFFIRGRQAKEEEPE